MPKKVKATITDSLCTIAMREGGFENCKALRDDPANAKIKSRRVRWTDWVTVPDKKAKGEKGQVNEKHKFSSLAGKPPEIRFVRGSKDNKAKDDHSLSVLQISNYRTDKGGIKGDKSFPSGFGYQKNAHADPDTFKIEVFDPQATGGSLKVELEALKRKVDDKGKAAYWLFKSSDPDADKRKIEVECKRTKSSKLRYRSAYLRLVTDVDDFNAAAGQTLLVTDMADGNKGDADKVEILEQRVRAGYKLPKCPKAGDDKAACVIRKSLNVGRKSERKRVKIAVNVLRKSYDGAAVATEKAVRAATLSYLRRIYAQAEMSMRWAFHGVRLIQPCTNLVAIENETGRKATGGKKIKLEIKVTKDIAGKDVTKTVEYTTRAGDTPYTTAKRLGHAIYTKFDKKVGIRYSENPPITGKARGSADVRVGDANKQKVKITIRTNNDATHKVKVGRVLNGKVVEFGSKDSHVGTLDERTLAKNNYTNSKTVNLYVVEELSAKSCGEAFTRNQDSAATAQPKFWLENSVIVFKTAVANPPKFHTTIPHEIGHVIADKGHVTKVAGLAGRKTEELMGSGSPVGATETVVHGPKRISDPANAALNAEYDDGKKGNPRTLFRTRTTKVIDGW